MTIDIRKPLKKFIPIFLKAQEDNLNEADTVQRLIKFFEDALSYSPLEEITREMQINDKYVDIALKIDGKIQILVEVKKAGVELRNRHIEQAERYASEGNIKWILLTNGIVWNLFHLTFDEGIEYERVFSVDLNELEIEKAANLLSLLHRQSIKKGYLNDYWSRRSALSPESIKKSLFNQNCLRLLRREIRQIEGIWVDEEDIAKAIHEMFSVETRERIGPLKIIKKTFQRAKKQNANKKELITQPTSSTGITLDKKDLLN